MRIGIDFDDVIIDFVGSLLVWHNKKYNIDTKLEQVKSFDLSLIFGTSREETINRVSEFLENHDIDKVPPLKAALESIEKLSKNNEINIITGRPAKFNHKMEEWLMHHLKRKLTIIHAGDLLRGQYTKKSETCKELGIPILLEDAPEVALDCTNKGIKVILFDKPWNQEVSHKNIKRVKNWKETMKEISIFDNNNN